MVGSQLEHRLVMEVKLGRPLDEYEVIHHINGIKHDNRPENLEVFADQSVHTRHHTVSDPLCRTRKASRGVKP